MKTQLIFAVLASATMLTAGEIFRPSFISGGEEKFLFKTAFEGNDLNKLPLEKGTVSVNEDDINLYIKFNLDDCDLITEAKENQARLVNSGDAVQIFFKSQKDTRMWELQYSANGYKSSFIHAGPGALFYTHKEKPAFDFSVKSNASNGKWCLKITIPKKAFTSQGFKFNNEELWTVMVSRANFTRFNDTPAESSSFPQAVKRASDARYFAKLILKK